MYGCSDTRLVSRLCVNPACAPTVPNPCMPNGVNYCQNGGQCYLQSAGSQINQPACKCPGDKTGNQCQTQAPNNVCTAAACVNGTCWRVNDAAVCDCNPGWFGTACDQNPCTPGGNNYCQNGGVCSINLGSPICDCSATQCNGSPCLGAACNVTAANPCGTANAPNCQNNGTCTYQFGVTRCQCQDGFSGDNCEIKSKMTSNCNSIEVRTHDAHFWRTAG